MDNNSLAAVPVHLALPLISSLVYVLGALLLKRAGDLGADVWSTTRICNVVAAVLFAPLLLLGGTVPSWQLWWQPAVVALLFLMGQVFTLMALKVGDVSVATPVLGVKVLLVALLTTILLGEQISDRLWTAALLSSAAIVLLNFTRAEPHHRVALTILTAVLAASANALFDVLVQKWSPAWGAGRFLPVMTGWAALYSLAIPGARMRQEPGAFGIPATAYAWVAGGAFCFGVQAVMLISFIAVYGQATVANVLYSSRGLWSVLAVWAVGHWFTSREREYGARVLSWRVLGAALLLCAIVIVLAGRSNKPRPADSGQARIALTALTSASHSLGVPMVIRK